MPPYEDRLTHCVADISPQKPAPHERVRSWFFREVTYGVHLHVIIPSGGLIGLIINYDDPSKIRPGYSVAKQGIHTLSSPVRASNSIEALCQPMSPGPSRPSRKCNSALKLEIPSQNPGLNLPYTSYKLPLSNYNGQSNGNRFVQFVGLRGGRARSPWFFLPFCARYGILIIKIRLVCACSAGKKKG